MIKPDRIKHIQQKLQNALSPTQLEVIDDSHLHIGHPGASQGAGHYTIKIRCEQFHGKSLIEQHRLVYQVLEDLIPTEIHALKISTR